MYDEEIYPNIEFDARSIFSTVGKGAIYPGERLSLVQTHCMHFEPEEHSCSSFHHVFPFLGD